MDDLTRIISIVQTPVGEEPYIVFQTFSSHEGDREFKITYRDAFQLTMNLLSQLNMVSIPKERK